MTRRVCVPQTPYWIRYGHDIFVEALVDVFRGLGFEVDTPDQDESEPWEYGPDDLVLFVENYGARKWIRRIEAAGRGAGRAKRLYFNVDPLKGKNLEQPVVHEISAILDYCGQNKAIWTKNGWDPRKVVHCGMGYHSTYERHVCREPSRFEPDGIHLMADVTKARRRDVVRLLGAEGVEVNHRTFGDDRQGALAFVASPGVHLNVQRHHRISTFGWIRILMFHLMARSFVLSEELGWYPDGFESGRHWVVAPFESLPEVAERWLARPDERREIGEAGYQFMKRHHRLETQLPAALKKIGVI